MNKTKKRMGMFLALLCSFVIFMSFGMLCACNDDASGIVSGGAWHYGISFPADGLGQEGDFYLNTKTLASYKKSDAGWVVMSVEESGDWLYGVGAPADEGKVNDFYLDTASGDLYRKTESGWGAPILTLKGKPGRDGVIWFSGTEADPNTYEDGTLNDALEGDFYLDQTNFEVWQLGKDGTWVDLGSLKGKVGEQGTTGPQGPEGPTGSQGPQGNPGKDGQNGKSAYELYVEQYKAEHGGTEGMAAGEKEWLESLKGDKGDAGQDSVHFFNGKGEPENNDATQGAVEGDLYVGQFDGLDGKGTGSKLYRYMNGEWKVIMESMTMGTVSIYSLDTLIDFGKRVAEGNSFENTTIQLKANIDFNEASIASIMARSAVDWTPIGTASAPFKGTFDGEDHIISNFTVTTSDSAKPAGFFGNVEDATIKNLHFENATVTATGSNVVGAVVVGESKGEVNMSNVTVSGTVTAESNAKVGGLVGKNNGGTVKAKDVEVMVPGLEAGEDGKQAFVGTGDITMEGDYATGKEVSTGFVEKTVYSSAGEATGTSYEVLNKDGLINFAKSVNGTDAEANNYKEKKITLAEDIDLTGENWTPIGNSKSKFLGSFDGQGHTIFNLKIVRDSNTSASYYGLFGDVGANKDNLKQNNVIENLTIENVDIPATASPTDEKPHGETGSLSYVGAFAGRAYGTDLKNLTLKGNVYVDGKSYVGGIVGLYYTPGAESNSSRVDSVIENIVIDAKGELGRGAVIGTMASVAADKSNKDQTVTLTNIKVTGVTLKGDRYVGGIIGHIQTIRTTVTIDGVVLKDVKILTTGCNNNSTYDEVGAIVGAESNTEDYESKKNTVVLKNLSGNISVEKNPTDKYQAIAVNDGVIGTPNDVEIVRVVLTIENNTLEITWYGVPIVAE